MEKIIKKRFKEEPKWLIKQRMQSLKMLKQKKILPKGDAEAVIDIPKNTDNNIIFCDIKTAIKRHDKILKKYLIVPDNEDAALNNTFFNAGLFIYIPENTRVEMPLKWIFSVNPDSNIFARNFIIVKRNSSLTLSAETISGENAIFNEYTNVIVEDEGVLNFFTVQNMNAKTSHFSQLNAFLSSNSKTSLLTAQFGSDAVKSIRECVLAGEGAKLKNTEIFLTKNNQDFNLNTYIKHTASYTTSNIVIKAVLNDTSHIRGHELIRIDKDIKNCDTNLSEHTILLNKESRAEFTPSLEIESNEVNAVHSASSAPIDNEQIYYMISRGMEENNAKKMIVSGFLDANLHNLVKKKIMNIINKRL